MITANKNFLFIFILSCFLFAFSGCNSIKKEEVLVLEKDFHPKLGFPYKPTQINISYTKDSIFIHKTFKSGEERKYNLYLKEKEFYFLNKKKTKKDNYTTYSYLFLKNQGPDSCYSVSRQAIDNYSGPISLQGIDLCFSKIKGGNFTTIARFNIKGNSSYSENYFYDKNYKIYKIALRYNDTLYWYKIEKL